MRALVLIVSLASIVSSSALANDFAAAVGARTDTWTLSPSQAGISAGGNTGFQLGVLAFLDVAPSVTFRSGFMYTQRVFTLTSSGSETDYTYTYFDIPLTLEYKFAEYGGVFAGGLLALNVGKSANNGASTDGVESSAFGYEFGVSFKFAPQLGAELYYEAIPGNIQSASGTSGKAATSVVANLLFTFE